ncbi:TrkH family potassium uptake protein [Ornithinibacillus sp. L9]|uniref:TrkH family potassium uptake protein n=1 Tax=Ornithinibacillus caprae TaxID=2678566 RepID=A0A6N8FRR2_9BACI|nr:TrkH family potassium uptake protein [Ornithinibacillus caprae]MUK90518.1 TrkH family potassium uptake protein [Ornithinibacillus caprae]
MLRFLKKDPLSPAQIIVLFYVVAVILSICLLSLPITTNPGVDWSFLDIVFTAVSAISVTGLTVVSTVDTFSTPGTFILLFILQFGGIGIMTLGTFFWLLIGKKIGLKERTLIRTDQNQSHLSGLVYLMKQILTIILLIEFVGAIILGTYFLHYFPTWQEAYLQGLFAAVSATTNAGFDITGSSLIPFAQDYFVQMINIILLTLGAIGFPVLIEVKDFIKEKSKYRGHFSLYTKLTTITFFSLMAFGTIVILIFEANYFFADKSWHESFFYAFFQSSTTRNGGLATMDVSEFSIPTLLTLCFLMFIGASPSSVGGGIRTTTFAVIILLIWSYSKGRKHIKVFKREIHEDDIRRSVVVSFLAIVLWFTAVVILTRSETFSLMEIMFEVSSAFGTTGLSMGITPELSSIGKIVIISLMFIGRIGILSFVFIFHRRLEDVNYHYPTERLIVG